MEFTVSVESDVINGIKATELLVDLADPRHHSGVVDVRLMLLIFVPDVRVLPDLISRPNASR